MGQKPWWRPGEDDPDRYEPLPGLVILSADYSAELPLWGEACGNIPWQATRLSPGLLDRLAAWQEEFDANFDYERGWRSAEVRGRWAREAEGLAADLRTELGTRAEVVVDLWPLRS